MCMCLMGYDDLYEIAIDEILMTALMILALIMVYWGRWVKWAPTCACQVLVLIIIIVSYSKFCIQRISFDTHSIHLVVLLLNTYQII